MRINCHNYIYIFYLFFARILTLFGFISHVLSLELKT